MNREPSPPRTAVAGAAVALAITLGGWLVLSPPAPPRADSDWPRFYQPVARSLADGHGWTAPPGMSPIAYPPGYPLLAAAALSLGDRTGLPEATAMRAFNALCTAAGGALIATIMLPLTGRRRAVVAAAAWAAYPPGLWLSAQPLSEVPFAVLLLGTLAVRRMVARETGAAWWKWIALGAVAGGAALVRPIAVALGGLMAVLPLVDRTRTPRHRVVAATFVLLGNLMALLPWQIWATARTGHLVVLSSGGAASVVDGLTWAVRDKGYRSAAPVPHGVQDVMASIVALGPAPTLREVGGALAAQTMHRPASVATLVALKLVRPFFGTDSGRHEGLVALVNVAVLTMVAVAWRRRRHAPELRQAWAEAGAVFVLFWGMAFAVLSVARYLAPPLALLCGMAAASIVPAKTRR